MKTKILTAFGLLTILTGAMMGDSKRVTLCLTLLAIGVVLLLISVRTASNESPKSKDSIEN